MNNSLLEMKDINTTFTIKDEKINVIRGVNLKVQKGEILGIVGESGSGKSILTKTLLDILPENAKLDSGEILFEGTRLDTLKEKEKRAIRGNQIAMIFQDPMTALNPLKTIGSHLIEVAKRKDHSLSKKNAKQKAIDTLKLVGIPSPEKRLKQYPHEFSGGMRQRVMIAMALIFEPKLLVADEPTTALDVTIQSQILDLLKSLNDSYEMSIILITHDLGIVASTCTRIVVMYGGQVMEEGLTEEIFYHPKHPYTKALLKAIPNPLENGKNRLATIPGSAPSLSELTNGCPFAKRCSYATEQCRKAIPPTIQFSNTHLAQCILSDTSDKIINES